MFIYCVTNKITNKKYIGQTRRKIQRRWRQHITDKRYGSLLYNSIVKYGEDNFIVEHIDTASSIEELNLKEQFWIKFLNTLKPYGYNLTTGGDGKFTVTDHTREKISKSWENRKITDETKKRMSEGHKRRFRENPELKQQKAQHLAKSYGHLKGKQVDHNARKVYCFENNTTYRTVTEAAKALWADPSSIVKVCKGKLKKTKDLTFKYVD